MGIAGWSTASAFVRAVPEDPVSLAVDLANVVRKLQAVPTHGAPPPYNRARPLQEYGDSTHWAIDHASHLIDARAAMAVWEEALAVPPHAGPTVRVQGDLEGNCLVRDGRLCGIVDWGSACAGDPAVDVQVVRSPFFTDDSRRAFSTSSMSTMPPSPAAAALRSTRRVPRFRTTCTPIR